MKTYTKFLTLILVIPVLLAFSSSYVSAITPPYIQPGLKFVYQMYEGQTQRPENIFHNYIVESVSARNIVIRIESDVVRSLTVEVDGGGNLLGGGGRIDLWIPSDIQVGQSLKLMGYDAIVAQKNFDIDGSGRITFTVVSSLDQTIMWLYVDGGSLPQASQLQGLLFGVIFPSSKKFLVFTKVEQVQVKAVTTTRSVQTVTSKAVTVSTISTVTSKNTITQAGKTTYTMLTTTTVIQTTVTFVSTITTQSLETYFTTVTTESTVTQHTQIIEASTSPLIPLPIAIVVALAIIGGGLFYMKSRSRPLPPRYPYSPYPTAPPPPAYPSIQQAPPPPPQITGYCPACRYPVYSGDIFCRRCGYRVS